MAYSAYSDTEYLHRHPEFYSCLSKAYDTDKMQGAWTVGLQFKINSNLRGGHCSWWFDGTTRAFVSGVVPWLRLYIRVSYLRVSYLSYLCCLRTDISGIDQASLFHLIIISPSFYLCQFLVYLTCKCLWISSHWFFQLFRHNKSPPFHSVIFIHLISLPYHIIF